jgi:oligopeptide/dipeptide ABC transporter ATP-binding protein
LTASPSPSNDILSARDVRVHYPVGRRQQLKALDGVTFAVSPGETFGIIGESGSGKSTLGRTLVCLEKPTSGQVLHRDADPFALPERALRRHRREFQIIFQDPNAALDPRRTILQSVREPLDVQNEGSRVERWERSLLLIERVGLSRDQADRYPHELSGGQKQRANIARALVLRPSAIICDEVVAALDLSIQSAVLNLFVELQREYGLTYVFITHDLSVVSHISDRLAVMYLGRFMELGPVDAVTESPRHPYTQALLAAEPVALPRSMRTPERVLPMGEIPSPINPPSGCRFRTRCPYANELCTSMEPEWRQLTVGHWVACHYPRQA